jgi:hypothetical protein
LHSFPTVIGFGIFGMNRWSAEATNLIITIGWNAMQLPAYVFDRNMLLLGATMSSSIMAIMVFLSVLKPWGRRKQIKEIAALANPVS